MSQLMKLFVKKVEVFGGTTKNVQYMVAFAVSKDLNSCWEIPKPPYDLKLGAYNCHSLYNEDTPKANVFL